MKLSTIISPIFCLLAFGPGTGVNAQKWSGVTDPLATRQVYHASAFQNKLWLLDDGDASTGTKATALRLKTWDNASWSAYPEYVPGGVSDSIHGQYTFGAVDTSMYVSYTSFFSGIPTGGLLRFDIPSEKWVKINTNLSVGSEIRSMVWYNNDLYLGGNLTNAQGINQLIRIKHQFGFAEVYGSVSGDIDFMAVHEGTLYFGGEFDSIGNIPINNLALFKDDVFTEYSGNAGKTSFLKSISGGTLSFQEEQTPQLKYLYSISSAGDMILNGDFPADFTIRDLDKDKSECFSLQYSNAALYPAGVYHLDKLKSRWYRMETELDPMRSLFVHTGKFLYLVELSGNASHLETNALAYFSGRLFVDIDDDCSKTMGDRMLDQPTMVREIISDQHWLAEKGTGTFGGFVSEGNYEIELPALPPRLSGKVCNWGNKFTLNPGDSVFYDIPLSVTDTNAAVRVKLTAASGFRARQGFEENYVLQVHNEGFRSHTCPFYLRFPEEIQFTGADIMPYDSVGGGIYVWKVHLAPFEMMEINLKGSVNLFTPAYTKVILDAWTDSSCLRYNNRDSLVLKVVGAYDPNDKQNSPEGFITPSTKRIDYHIRFQNTGTDTATNVYVVDTIDLTIPLREVRLGKVSHPYQISFNGPRITFTFTNIMLPDSSVDMEGSNGYINYSVLLYPTLKHGDSIENTAYIYFDYQDPVMTNTVYNDMRKPESALPPLNPNDRYVVYPNPSRGNFSVLNLTGSVSACKVFDAQGKHLGTWKLAAEGETAIDLGRYSPGIYFLKFPDWNAQESIILTR